MNKHIIDKANKNLELIFNSKHRAIDMETNKIISICERDTETLKLDFNKHHHKDLLWFAMRSELARRIGWQATNQLDQSIGN